MWNVIAVFVLLAGLSVPTIGFAETIHATVNGLVCGFCATGIEKTFKEEASVENVAVDLESKLVTVELKKGQQMDDATFSKLVTNAGYNVVSIKRDKNP